MAKSKNGDAEASNAEAMIPLPRALTGKGFSSVRDIIQTNLGANANLGFSDLTKIPMPAGGGTIWEIPSATGDSIETKTITGVVVAFQDAKSFWKDSIEETGGGSPPDCRSTDLVQGIGTPGILCAECPNNRFGSAMKGKGKACKDIRILYILTDSSLLPKVIVVPPTSLKELRKTFLALAAEQEIPFFGATLSFSLVKDKNDGGIVFSRIVVKVENLLDEEAYEKARAYKEMLEPMLGAMFSQVIEGNSTHDEENYDEGQTIDVAANTASEVGAEEEALA